MDATDPIEDALARWLAHGVTSSTNPVLRFALNAFLAPLGIEAEALEAEPFGGLESGSGEWWLRNPRWSAARFDRRHSAAEDFGYFLQAPGSFTVEISSRGWLRFAQTGPDDLAAATFFRSSEDGWLAARHSVQASREVEAFLCAAAGLLLTDASFAALYASRDVLGFCEAVRRGMA